MSHIKSMGYLWAVGVGLMVMGQASASHWDYPGDNDVAAFYLADSETHSPGDTFCKKHVQTPSGHCFNEEVCVAMFEDEPQTNCVGQSVEECLGSYAWTVDTNPSGEELYSISPAEDSSVTYPEPDDAIMVDICSTYLDTKGNYHCKSYCAASAHSCSTTAYAVEFSSSSIINSGDGWACQKADGTN